jgi:trehalose/maltose transport system permease protein
MSQASSPKNGWASEGNQPTRGRAVAAFFGILFFTLGVLAIVLLLVGIANDPGLAQVTEWVPTENATEPPSIILAFLYSFGIVVPVLLIGFALGFMYLGVRLFSQQINYGRWAQIGLLWLAVGAFFFAFFSLINVLQFSSNPRNAESFDIAWLIPVGVGVVAGSLLLLLYWLLNRVFAETFFGQEPLNAQQTRLAWNLLIPTLAVFVLVAARPLEQTFIRSLTDKRFASSEIPNFVGLENYQSLLGFRFDTVSCRIDDDTGSCEVRADGSVRWERIDRSLREQGYGEVTHIPLPATAEGQNAIAVSGTEAKFLTSIWTTLVFTVFSVTLELSIGLFIAMAVNTQFAGRGLMRAVMLIPWAIPTVISARLWELMLKDTGAGVINSMLRDLGLISEYQAWLTQVSLQLPAAILVDVWKTSSFMALLLLAGLQTIPSDLYEAAAVDGASKVRQFFSITIPLLRPTIAVALVFRTLDSLRVFDLFNVLFGARPTSMATFNYETLVNNQQDGYASAVSMIIFVLISVFAVIYVRMLRVETD